MRWIATSFPVILALLIFQGSGFAEQMQIESVTTELVFLKDGEKLLVVKPDIGQLPKDVAVLGAELRIPTSTISLKPVKFAASVHRLTQADSFDSAPFSDEEMPSAIVNPVGGGYVSFFVEDALRAWLKDKPNLGLGIKVRFIAPDYFPFKASNHAGALTKPKLIVDYVATSKAQ